MIGTTYAYGACCNCDAPVTGETLYCLHCREKADRLRERWAEDRDPAEEGENE